VCKTVEQTLPWAGARAHATERYDIDRSHSGVIFGWNHFGFSNPTARVDEIQGSVLLDKADLTNSSISIALPKSVTLDATVNKIGIFEIPGVIKAETAGFDATAARTHLWRCALSPQGAYPQTLTSGLRPTRAGSLTATSCITDPPGARRPLGAAIAM
jgi:hypothetical protein